MFVGNVLAIQQSNIKRMLAYSSIAQAGTILIGLAAVTGEPWETLGSGAILFYLAGYTVTNLTAFLVVIAVFNRIGSYAIDDYRGLGRRAPLLGLLLAFSLASLTGLPLTAGFFGKIYLFDAAVQSNLTWLAIVGGVNTTISAAYYLRPIKAMFIDQAPEGALPPGRWTPGLVLSLTLAATAAGILVIGLAPSLLIDVADEAAAVIVR